MTHPRLRRMAKGWLLITRNGDGYLIDWLWFHGAAHAFALATVKAWIANAIITLFGLRSWNERLLPTYGDWIFRDQGGRLESLAMFIDCELERRAKAREAA